MRIVSLASGSHGNATLVASQGEILLIDCGLSCRTLMQRCQLVGIDPAKISAVLFTHDHRDHTYGVPTFHKRHPETPLYANWMTAEAITAGQRLKDAPFYTFENGQAFTVGGFEICPFSIPHDVPDPVGYLVRTADATYFHATDVGTPLDSIGVHLAEADIALLESNHDPILLQQSNRPDQLKRRIRGPRGHLSNDDAAGLVRKWASPKLKCLALAHLSQECNEPHLAERVMRETLLEMNRMDIHLSILSQYETHEI